MQNCFYAPLCFNSRYVCYRANRFCMITTLCFKVASRRNWQNGREIVGQIAFQKCSEEQRCQTLAWCLQQVSKQQVRHQALWLVSSLTVDSRRRLPRDGRDASCFWVGGGHADWPTEPPRVWKRPSGRDHRHVPLGNCAQLTSPRSVKHLLPTSSYIFFIHRINSRVKDADAKSNTSVALFF